MRRMFPSCRLLLAALSLLISTALSAQYCTNFTTNPCSAAGFIKRVALSNIDNDNNICDNDLVTIDGYSDYTGDTIYIAPGGNYQLTVEVGNGLFANMVTAWVDWNQDSIWSEDEIMPLVGSPDVGFYTGVVLIPAGAVENVVGRIRVIMDWTVPPVDPCAASIQGEVEDYSFIVTDSLPPSSVGGGSSPVYCIVGADMPCSGNEIKRFALKNVDNDNNLCDKEILTGVADGYSDYSEDFLIVLNQDSVYTATLEILNTLFLDVAVLWVDWDADGAWTETELSPFIGESTATNMFTAAIVPPATAVTGQIARIRVMSDFMVPPTDPCANTLYGEVEDYSFILLPSGETVPDCVDLTKVVPANNSANQCLHQTLRWPDTGADSYLLSIRDTSNNVYIVSNFSTTDTSYTFSTALSPGAVISWVAIPVLDGIQGYSCDSALFTTSPNLDPTTAILPAGDTLSTCLNFDITVFGSPMDGTTPYAHQWTGLRLGHLSNPTDESTDFAADTAGFYTYFYQVTDANGCKASDSVNILVNALPKLGELTVADSVLCVGENLNISYKNYEGTVSWVSFDPLNGQQLAPVTMVSDTEFVYTNMSESILLRAVQNDGSCVDTTASVEITVNPLPASPIVVNTGRDSICPGESSTLVVSNYTEGLTWDDANLTTNDSLTVDLADSYVVTYVDANGCSSNASYTISEHLSPAKPSILSAPGAPYCEGDTVTLSSTGTNTTWGDTAGNFAVVDSLILFANGSYFATSTNAAGCTSLSDTVEVVFNAPPAKPSITDLSASHCDGDTVQLQTDVTNPVWSSGETTSTIAIYSAGKFVVTDTNAFGCFSTSDTLEIVYYPIPAKPTITQQVNDLVCDSTGQEFYWFFEDGTLAATTQNPRFTPVKGGMYVVVAVSANGCISEPSDAIKFSGTGILSYSGKAAGKVYPNPASHEFTVEANRKEVLTLIDGLGRAVQKWDLLPGQNNLKLDVGAGVYILNFSESGTTKLTVY